MEKKKPYASVGSNAIWVMGKQLKYSPWVFAIHALSIPVGVGMSYAAIYLPSLVVKEVAGGNSLSEIALHVGILMLLMLIGGAIESGSKLMLDGLQQNFRMSITLLICRKAMSIHYQQYEDKNTRDLFHRAQRATQQWGGIWPVCDMPRQTAELVKSILCYLLFGSVISVVSPWLLPILTIAPLINWLCVRAYHKYEYNNREKCADEETKLWYVQQQTADFATGKDIRIYGMAEWFGSLFRGLHHDISKWETTLAHKRFLSQLADLVVILVRDGVAYWILITMTLQGQITVDKFVLYFAAISSFATWVGNILNGWNQLHANSLKLCDLREFAELEEGNGSGEIDVKSHLSKAPEIVFDHVSFRYEGAEKEALHDISFTMKPGEKVALVGLNGAGKTTLVKLLCGLYRPTSGEIRVNGVPIDKFRLTDYYQLFSVVFQDIRTGFFSLAQTVSGTAGENVNEKKVELCMRMAGLSEKLDSLPDGIYTRLDKQLHENGTELSGGEAQKLMLARALYKDAPMLVLDEPTAALDPIAENRIYQEYHEMSAKKTALFISHRLASTRFCDRILYLENGEIVEKGTHEQLVKLGGKYSELFEIQSCWYREEYEKGEGV